MTNALVNVEEIAEVVANRVLNKIDANTADFVMNDFDFRDDDAVWGQIVEQELESITEGMDFTKECWYNILEALLESSNLKMAFETAKIIAKDWESDQVQAEEFAYGPWKRRELL
jgi:hypothetical protein